MLVNESKIRKLLGNEYHLCVTCDFVNEDKWILFREYKNQKVYFSEDNTPIMSSEKNSEKELLDFAKKHHKINEKICILNVYIVVGWLCLLLAILNALFFKDNVIKGFIYGIDFMILLGSVAIYIISNKNHKVDMLKFKEDREQIFKEYKNDNN